MQKPDILYHASADTNITEFEPRNQTPRYEGEPNLIFATPHKQVAAMFLVPRGIPTEISKYGDIYAVFVNGTEEEFDSQDKGGAIYALPSDTFETDEKIGMGETEWVSTESVKPVSKDIYDTALQALEESNVQIYFLFDEVFTLVRNDPSHGLEIVQNQMNAEYDAAILADKNDTLTEWMVDYLNDNDRGRNISLAGGLAEAGQFHTHLIDYPIEKFKILMGPDHAFRYYEDPDKFNSRVEAMVESLKQGWKPVPFIVTDIWNDGLELNDGSHRAEALKRFGVETYSTVFYFKDQAALDDFVGSLS